MPDFMVSHYRHNVGGIGATEGSSVTTASYKRIVSRVSVDPAAGATAAAGAGECGGSQFVQKARYGLNKRRVEISGCGSARDVTRDICRPRTHLDRLLPSPQATPPLCPVFATPVTHADLWLTRIQSRRCTATRSETQRNHGPLYLINYR